MIILNGVVVEDVINMEEVVFSLFNMIINKVFKFSSYNQDPSAVFGLVDEYTFIEDNNNNKKIIVRFTKRTLYSNITFTCKDVTNCCNISCLRTDDYNKLYDYCKESYNNFLIEQEIAKDKKIKDDYYKFIMSN